MLRFRQMTSLHKFASAHANLHNHFNLERRLIDRQTRGRNQFTLVCTVTGLFEGC